MTNYYPLIITSIAGFSAMLGNIFLFINKKYEKEVLSFALGISSSVMFLISILELIPESILIMYHKTNLFSLIFYSLALLLLGYILVNYIDKKINNKNNIYKIGILSAMSLLIHNLPEGILCAITTYSNLSLGLKMSFIIMIHNITEGIAICLPVYYGTNNKKKAILITLISSFGEVVGALITIVFLKNFINDQLIFIILLITAGIMITLSLGKILKEGISIKKYQYFLLGIIIGLIIVLFTL